MNCEHTIAALYTGVLVAAAAFFLFFLFFSKKKKATQKAAEKLKNEMRALTKGEGGWGGGKEVVRIVEWGDCVRCGRTLKASFT